MAIQQLYLLKILQVAWKVVYPKLMLLCFGWIWEEVGDEIQEILINKLL
jgi:hypothetical protein